MAGNVLQAKRYSQAIFQIALEKNELERWQKDLQKIAALARNTELVEAIDNPRFSLEQKSKLLKNQLKDINPLAMNLVLILTNLGRFKVISEIYTDYQTLKDEHQGVEKAEVTTSVPLDENERQKLTVLLQSITSKKIVLEEKIDTAVIGGLVVRVGGKIVDGSTHTQLDLLRENLARAGG